MKSVMLPSIRCSEKLRQDLQLLADQQGRSLSNMILFLIKLGLKF